jgi:anti-sigma factor RsiW
MNHPTEEQLILHYYGEEAGFTEGHLPSCESCREDYRKLQRILNTVESLPVPERPAEYGTQVWNRVRPRLGSSPRRWWSSWLEWRRAALVAGTACLMLVAFLAGRLAQRPSLSPQVANAPVRERILLVAVGDHLERSQTVLAELSNLGPGHQGRVDISYEQRAAEDLVESSRLYRMSATSSGDNATASLLDELERVLLDVSHGPSNVSDEQLQQLQRRIAEAGILFKVRVFATHVERRENSSKL